MYQVIGMDSFGLSAPKEDILNHFGFTVETITDKIKEMFEEKNKNE